MGSHATADRKFPGAPHAAPAALQPPSERDLPPPCSIPRAARRLPGTAAPRCSPPAISVPAPGPAPDPDPGAPHTAVQPGELWQAVGADEQVQGHGHRAPLDVLQAEARAGAGVHLPTRSRAGSAGGTGRQGKRKGGDGARLAQLRLMRDMPG